MKIDRRQMLIQNVEALRKQDIKFDHLCLHLENLDSIAVAFSGGVDSTFLIALASVISEKVKAITVKSPYIATWEIDEATDLTKDLAVTHDILEVGIPSSIQYNPIDRCYLCKHEIFSTIKAKAATEGFEHVCDGSNFDDLGDYRPGMRALRELEVCSPLLDCEVTKAEIRKWSKYLKLETWDKPPYACLLTRIPYDTQIIQPDLTMIERSEFYLMTLGIKAIRVRKHENLARIEISADEFEKILNANLMAQVADKLKSFGFEHVTLDLAGYKMGSFNAQIASLQEEGHESK